MRRYVGWAMAVGVAALLEGGAAHACGGCFHPPEVSSSSTVVTGHRMAFAVSAERTVLWDQFEYSGSPEDFSWVLPVAPGAYLELASDAFFNALDAVTRTRVESPRLRCADNSSGGFACGGMSDSNSSRAGLDVAEDMPVQVLERRSVGPYETVTLRSSEGDALRDWLAANGYVVPDGIDPIIDAYVAEGADFIALRLAPSAEVQQMRPVRVVTPGGEGLLPLRMVAAGIGDEVDIVLYVIAEARYSMPDIAEVRVDYADLSWDWQADDSNYAALRALALAKNLGRSYLTTYAQPGAFGRSYVDAEGQPVFFSTASGSLQAQTLAELYFSERLAPPEDPEWPVDTADGAPAAGRCASQLAALNSDALVVESGAGAQQVDASSLVCADHDDLAAAAIGMHPARAWVTRLEMKLPREALDGDCVVEEAVSQDSVTQLHRANINVNRPEWCQPPAFDSSVSGAEPPSGSRLAWLVALGALGSALLRRRRRPAA